MRERQEKEASKKEDEARNNPGEKGGNGPEEEDILAENVEVEKEASKKSTSEANEVSTATISCISRTVTFAFTTNSVCFQLCNILIINVETMITISASQVTPLLKYP